MSGEEEGGGGPGEGGGEEAQAVSAPVTNLTALLGEDAGNAESLIMGMGSLDEEEDEDAVARRQSSKEALSEVISSLRHAGGPRSEDGDGDGVDVDDHLS